MTTQDRTSENVNRKQPWLALGLIVLGLAGTGKALAMTDEVRNMCQQSESLINSGRFKEAIQLLNRAATMDPTCGEVHGYLGMAYQNSSNTAQAIQEYSKAVELNPQMSFININLGSCYLNMNQLDQAVPYFQRYLQDNPNGPDAEKARMYIQQAGARHGQQNLRGVMEQGQQMLAQRRYTDALKLFDQAAQQQPNFAPAHFYRGFALAQAGQNKQAIAAFQTCLQLDPTTKEAVINIASNYQSLGDCANAIKWYEKYLHDNPGSPKAADVKQRISGLRQQMAQQGGNTPGAASAADYLTNASSGGKFFRWTRMPIRVCIASGASTPGYRDSFYQTLMDSFSKWAVASENRLAFQLVQNPAQADVFCDWTDNPAKVVEPGRTVEGGITKLSAQPLPNGDAGITNAKMTLLTNRGGAPLSDDDMRKVCLHEIGHALGINGHSSDNHDIMFFTESPTVWPALTKRDKATICRLYASYPRMEAGQ